MKDKLINIGYLLAIVSFTLSMILQINNNKDWGNSLLFIGGLLLLITSVIRILLGNKSNLNKN